MSSMIEADGEAVLRDPAHATGPVFASLSGKAALILGVLMLVNVVNFIDRQLPFILIESIKADLHLSDSEIGILAGLSFAIVYSFAAFPLAFLADRWSARHMLVLSLSLWSVMTAAAGFAKSFGFLLTARTGVAAGEAGCAPAAHSLIARLFPANRRAFVLSIYSLGVPIGSMTGLVLGGWINDVASWRTAFLIVGLPGLVLSLLVWAVLPRNIRPAAAPTERPVGLTEGVRYLFGLRSFRHMAAATSLFGCGSYAINVFASAFLIRVHGLTTAQAGLGFGLAFGLGGFAGTFLGGAIADRLAKRDPAWMQRLPAIGQLLCFPVALGAWLVPSAGVSIVLLGLTYVTGLLYFAPSFATAQMLAPDRMRASAVATLNFGLTLVGSSVGPIGVGWVSDRLAPQYGHLSLRYALCLMGITILWSGWHFWRASRLLRADLERSQA
jgi:predicted MFS family arabinose efflux permease